ncbi:MAG: NUDIX domain-containing protein [Bacteroidales bacterium]
MSDEVKGFNIRVYGIAFDERKRLLITDEYRLGMRMTKFPGGGLELGEGTIDCLRRECREEFGQEIRILDHFYTTDYFQPTYLLKSPHQLISIYYLIEPEFPEKITVSEKAFDFKDEEGAQTFRWVDLKSFDEEMMTFPIDRKVLGMLKEKLNA